jgi:DNA-binding XRE family transcriptional regulator
LQFEKIAAVSEEQAQYELSDYAVRLKYVREEILDMSQKDLGTAAGCSDITISNIENSVYVPHFDMMMKIIKACGMTFTEFSLVKIPEAFINQMPKPYRKSSNKKKKK